LLTFGTIAIIILSFVLPDALEQYALQAAQFYPSGVVVLPPESAHALGPLGSKASASDDPKTAGSLRLRVTGNFSLDSSRVKQPFIRAIGRFATALGHRAETGATVANITLPDYDGDNIVASATVAPIRLDIRSGRMNQVEALVDVAPPVNADVIKDLLQDVIQHGVRRATVGALVSTSIKSGVFSLGRVSFSHILLLTGMYAGYNLRI